MEFGRTKSGQYYKKSGAKDNNENPVTFADAYLDENQDLKDKHDFADERIAEQEEKDKIDAIKKEQEEAEKQQKNDELRLQVLKDIDDVILAGDNVDHKISLLEDYLHDSNNGLNDDDRKDLKQEIKELKEISKSADQREQKQSEDKQSEQKQEPRKTTRKHIPDSKRTEQKPEKDYSNQSNLGPDEMPRVSYLLATASDEK